MKMTPPDSALPTEIDGPDGAETIQWLDSGTLGVTFIPDFRLDELTFYFSPGLDGAKEAYFRLPDETAERWSAYFNKKGWRFQNASPDAPSVEGPYKVRPGQLRLEILEPGRLFAPRPEFRPGDAAAGIPLVGLEKKKPFDPWKPTYVRAINFIKKYEPVRPLSRGAQYALWEIEECGEVSGSTSWENGERLLAELCRDSEHVRAVLADVFEKRPEEFPLGSEVYLRVLANSGDAGFALVRDFHTHPQSAKRVHVARALGELHEPASLETLIKLYDDENPEVRSAALSAIGKVGVPANDASADVLNELLDSEDVTHRVWAAEALLRGGDTTQEKLLIQLVKETPLPLYSMGELGQIIKELELYEAVPFLIKRLKSDRVEIRDDAAEVLEALTGVDPQFRGTDDLGDRRQALRQWKSWWEEFKKSRKKSE